MRTRLEQCRSSFSLASSTPHTTCKPDWLRAQRARMAPCHDTLVSFSDHTLCVHVSVHGGLGTRRSFNACGHASVTSLRDQVWNVYKLVLLGAMSRSRRRPAYQSYLYGRPVTEWSTPPPLSTQEAAVGKLVSSETVGAYAGILLCVVKDFYLCSEPVPGHVIGPWFCTTSIQLHIQDEAPPSHYSSSPH